MSSAYAENENINRIDYQNELWAKRAVHYGGSLSLDISPVCHGLGNFASHEGQFCEDDESVPEQKEAPPEEGTCTNTPPATNTPLNPNNGGRSIDASALQMGDIILSTTSEKFSEIIRFGTDSPVSHTILYVGDGLVIESVQGGVRLVPLETALAESNLAVAVRYPGLTDDQALKIRDFAGKQLDKNYDFGYGVFKQAWFRAGLMLGQAICPDVDPELFKEALAKIQLGTKTNDSWFCSELVLAAYAAAGVPLTRNSPQWTSPGEILNLQSSGNLEYVGHLKYPLSSADNLESNEASDPPIVGETNEVQSEEEQSEEEELQLPGIDEIEREADKGLDLPSVCEILGTCGSSDR